MRAVQAAATRAFLALLALLTVLQVCVGLGLAGWVTGLSCGLVANVLLARALHRSELTSFGAANAVTLARATLGQAVAALVAAAAGLEASVEVLVVLAAAALVLDAVDGRVARHTHGVTPFGARFDMEADAFLILVLSVAAAPVVGWWVLLIGLARYLLLAAEQVWPWLRRPVPPRDWRKVVAAIQGVVLTVAVAQVLPPGWAEAALVVAVALLAESFGRDVWWLARSRARAQAPGRVVVESAHG